MSIRMHSTTKAVGSSKSSTSLDTAPKRMDLEMMQAVSKAIENPSPGACLVVEGLARERTRPVKLPEVCKEQLKKFYDDSGDHLDGGRSGTISGQTFVCRHL